MYLNILQLRLYSIALSRGFGAILRPEGISYLKTLAWNLSVSAGSGGRIPHSTIFLAYDIRLASRTPRGQRAARAASHWLSLVSCSFSQ